ncbi:uncharacterized protein [Elaeis guineensis]|uniref:uncharacterized protein n=1 Tax=Elaeis guineensis var. tenera TaxID=51953 RepID=UPI003C6DA8D2
MATFVVFSSLLLFSSAHAQLHPIVPQPRAPHGLVFENPMSFPPSAFEFFHPKSSPPAEAPLPLVSSFPGATSSKARAEQVVASVWSAPPSHGGVGAGGVAAVVFGLVFVVLVAMGASYVVAKRRANISRAHTLVQPDAV